MMDLLEALAAHAAPVNLKLLAAETRLHPSTAHRILNVMVRNRMVDRIEPGTYCLGLRLLELGTLVRARTGQILDPYFSATKRKGMLDTVAGVRAPGLATTRLGGCRKGLHQPGTR